MEPEERAAVVREARGWVSTPYHHKAAIKGAGVDCARILIEAFADAGLIERFDPGEYPPDWHLHRDEERYLAVVESYCTRVDESEEPLASRPDFTAQPGDIVIWRIGRTFSHSAIVTDWPMVVHAYAPEMRVVECDITGTPLSTRPMRHYSYWGTA